MSVDPMVYVVDDDAQARNSVCALVQSMGINTEQFSSGEEFLAKYSPGRSGCLVTDLRMFGISGLELQEELIKRRIFLPVVILTAYARTAITVRAVKAGAVAVLDKPYADDDLWDAIRSALAADGAQRAKRERREILRDRLEQLTPEEREILDMIVHGSLNKTIAQKLDVSVRTVENRRQEICTKMQAKSTADLIRLALETEADA
jgi:two-component system, LuxR family, response regulator FixJ